MHGAMNEMTRTVYVRDYDVGVQRWNLLVAEVRCDFGSACRTPASTARVRSDSGPNKGFQLN